MLQITPDNFQQAVLDSDKLVLVDFFADWCGPCLIMMPELEALERESDFTIVKADIDKNDLLVSEFGIRNVPTLIFFQEGKEVKRLVGASTKKELLTIAQSLAEGVV